MCAMSESRQGLGAWVAKYCRAGARKPVLGGLIQPMRRCYRGYETWRSSRGARPAPRVIQMVWLWQIREGTGSTGAEEGNGTGTWERSGANLGHACQKGWSPQCVVDAAAVGLVQWDCRRTLQDLSAVVLCS